MTIMTNQQGEPEALRPIARYKIGYATDDWGGRSSTPSGIPDPAGAWVRYKDHVAALVEAQQPAPSAAAMSPINRLIAYSAAAALRDLGYEWDEGTEEWKPTPTPQADSQPAAVRDYPPLPRVGAIGYASVVDIESYAKTLTIGPHLPGVRDIALWTTDQMRAYVDADRAARAPADSVTAPAGGEVAGWLPVHFNRHGFYGAPFKTEAEAKQYINQVHQSSDSVTLIARPFTWIATPPTQAADSVLEVPQC